MEVGDPGRTYFCWRPVRPGGRWGDGVEAWKGRGGGWRDRISGGTRMKGVGYAADPSIWPALLLLFLLLLRARTYTLGRRESQGRILPLPPF